MKSEDYKRQLIIANSLYEMGLDSDVIKTITTVSKSDLELYRKQQKLSKNNTDSSS